MQRRPHPRIWAKGTHPGPGGNALRAEPLTAVVYTPTPGVARWVESELERETEATMQIARSVHQLVKSLTEDPDPPRLLVIDLDAIEAGDLFVLHEIRPRGWFGSIVGIGHVPKALRDSLGVDRVVTPPFSRDQLRDVIASLRAPLATVPIEVMPHLLAALEAATEPEPEPLPAAPRPPSGRMKLIRDKRSSAVRAAQIPGPTTIKPSNRR